MDRYFCGDPTLAKRLGPKGTDGFGAMRSNMYLAEDRILCFEAVIKEDNKWRLGHVGAAAGETDNPTTMDDFIIQRRRWLNGAFASTVYSITHFIRIYKSGHNILRMALLHVQLVYNVVCLLLSWFGLAAFLLALFIVNDITAEPPANSPSDGFPFGSSTRIVNAVIQLVYIGTIVLQFVLALGSRPKNQFVGYLVSFIIFGIINLYFLVNVVYLAKRVIDYRFLNNGSNHYIYINEFYTNVGQLCVTVTACSVFGIYWVAGFLCLDPWHLFTCYAQYIFVVSSYTNILNIYAFSNSHDISWGNKEGREEDAAVWSQPSVRTQDSRAVIEEQSRFHEDLDTRFESTVKRALKPYSAPSSSEAKESFDDKMKVFRTRLVGAYIFSNFVLCIFVLNDSFKQLHFLGDAYWHKIWFFRIWMWANAGCFLMRLAGCLCHRTTGLFGYLLAKR
jgi:chitin synthase